MQIECRLGDIFGSHRGGSLKAELGITCPLLDVVGLAWSSIERIPSVLKPKWKSFSYLNQWSVDLQPHRERLFCSNHLCPQKPPPIYNSPVDFWEMRRAFMELHKR